MVNHTLYRKTGFGVQEATVCIDNGWYLATLGRVGTLSRFVEGEDVVHDYVKVEDGDNKISKEIGRLRKIGFRQAAELGVDEDTVIRDGGYQMLERELEKALEERPVKIELIKKKGPTVTKSKFVPRSAGTNPDKVIYGIYRTDKKEEAIVVARDRMELVDLMFDMSKNKSDDSFGYILKEYKRWRKKR